MKDANSPATTMAQYDALLPAWTKIQTVLDGTDAMRAAGQAYLPQHDNEKDEAYQERLQCATLLNMTKLTLESWVGRPFSEPITLQDDVPSEIVSLVENIDTLGSHLNVFCRNWFREGMAKAFSHVLVDMPRLIERSDGRPRSLADDREQNVRPYWVQIRPEQLFFAQATMVGGEEQLLEVRYIEDVEERDDFAIVKIPQIRRLRLVSGAVVVELWREVKSKSRKKEWQIVDSYTMEIDQIPLVTFYADRSGFMCGIPPLADLADLNIAHWQSGSDQRAVLTVARFPILACSGGVDEDRKIVIGPKKWLYTPDPQGRFYYVEHTGKAIQAGQEDLTELARQMGEYGTEWLKKRPNRETATARMQDSSESTSALQDATLRFRDAVETALGLTAKWLKLDTGGSVNIKTDFEASPLAGEGLRGLIEARRLKDISREAFVKQLKGAGLLDEDFDADEDALLLENEALELSQNMGPEPMPGEPDADE